MALYTYRAVNPNGKTVKGQLNANNDIDLYQRLRENGLELIDQREVKQEKNAFAFLQPKVKTRDLIQMCVHLEQLHAAGVTLIEGLADVRDSTEQRTLRDLVAEVYRDVAEGKSLSEAFARHPKVFDHVFTSLLSAGEESGNLTESFQQLTKHLKWHDAITSRIKKAVRYPSFMLIVLMVMFFFMMTSVVPQVMGFLTASGQELPMITIALVATSEFVQNMWYMFLVVPVSLFVLIRALRAASDEMAYKLDALTLRLPLIGPMIRKISLSRFAHFFAVMFGSGVPILQCLETANKVVSNRVLVASLAQVRQGVQDGNPLSTGMKDSGEFPSLVVRMVKIGEDSGNLTETLGNVTSFYDTDVNDTVDALIASIEPALTVVGGGLMAWIVAAVMGPMYDSFSKLGG